MKNLDYQKLPAPVAKYLNYVLSDKQRTIKEVFLKHSGYFRTSAKSRWVKIKGKQYFSTVRPEFKWIGKTMLFKAIDQFKEGKGSLRVKLFSLIPVVSAYGTHVDQAELLRWLGESVWFPTNLLPSEQLKWGAIDSSTAKITYTYNQINIYYIVTFNDKGEITRLTSERYMEKGRLEKWTGIVSDYKEFDGMKVPSHIEAIWSLESGDFKYVDFYVDSIDYTY